MSDEIRQDVQFDAEPERVYRALTDQDEFAKLTNASAEIGRAPGEAFTCFGGVITGRQIELSPGRRIVQAWRAGNWPEGYYSILTFELEPDGSGTRLRFRQAGHPDGTEGDLSSGWHKVYWEPLKPHFRERAPAEPPAIRVQ